VSGSAPVGVIDTTVVGVPDDSYQPAVRRVIQEARQFLLASVFIVDINAHHDLEMKIIALLRELGAASWRGVEVKLLIGSSEKNIAIGEACYIAHVFAHGLGVESRILASESHRGSHSKFVLSENSVLTGSHNWSLGAITGQFQDSVLVHSTDLAAYFRTLFIKQWDRAMNGRARTC